MSPKPTASRCCCLLSVEYFVDVLISLGDDAKIKRIKYFSPHEFETSLCGEIPLRWYGCYDVFFGSIKLTFRNEFKVCAFAATYMNSPDTPVNRPHPHLKVEVQSSCKKQNSDEIVLEIMAFKMKNNVLRHVKFFAL